MERKIYKVVEREGKIFGLPFADFGFVAILFVAIFFGGGVAGMFMRVSPIFYLIAVTIEVVLYVFLRIANGKKHPSYLFSYISAKFMQPKHLYIKEPLADKLKHKI